MQKRRKSRNFVPTNEKLWNLNVPPSNPLHQQIHPYSYRIERTTVPYDDRHSSLSLSLSQISEIQKRFCWKRNGFSIFRISCTYDLSSIFLSIISLIITMGSLLVNRPNGSHQYTTDTTRACLCVTEPNFLGVIFCNPDKIIVVPPLCRHSQSHNTVFVTEHTRTTRSRKKFEFKSS